MRTMGQGLNLLSWKLTMAMQAMIWTSCFRRWTIMLMISLTKVHWESLRDSTHSKGMATCCVNQQTIQLIRMLNMQSSKGISNTKQELKPLAFAKMAEMTVESKDHLILRNSLTSTIFWKGNPNNQVLWVLIMKLGTVAYRTRLLLDSNIHHLEWHTVQTEQLQLVMATS